MKIGLWERTKAFGRGVRKVTKQITLLRLLAAFGLASALVVNFGEDKASQTLDDYAAENDIPMEIFEGLDTDKMRVYRGNAYSYLHMPGQTSGNVFRASTNEGDESTLEVLGAGASAVISYPFALVQSFYDAATQEPMGAYALPGVTSNDTCFIRPSGEAPVSELVHIFTGIPESDLPDFEDAEHIVSAIILAHEARHCDEALAEKEGLFAGLQSLTIESETEADYHAMINIEEIFPDSDIPEIVRHARAMSPYRKGAPSAGHATALALDAYFNDRAMPTREEAHYTNEYLMEVVRREMADFDGDTDSREYYEAVYEVMQDVIDNPTQFAPPLAIRAAQLYLEAVDFFKSYEAPAPDSVNAQKPKLTV